MILYETKIWEKRRLKPNRKNPLKNYGGKISKKKTKPSSLMLNVYHWFFLHETEKKLELYNAAWKVSN